MTKFITISQTPVYALRPNGSYTFMRSLPEGTEVKFDRVETDPLSKRQVGIFANGERMYLDALSPLLDEVEAKSTRLWDWLIYIGIASGLGYAGYRYWKKKKAV